MGKTNWTRVFLGGLLAGIVLFVLGNIAWVIYLGKPWSAATEALGHPYPSRAIVFQLVVGILAVWLYSAIRPRYGSGPKTALIAGVAFWIMSALYANISLIFGGLFPAGLLLIESLTSLCLYVVATLAGAWIYKEQELG